MRGYLLNLTEAQHERLRREAFARRVSMADLARAGIQLLFDRLDSDAEFDALELIAAPVLEEGVQRGAG